MVFYVGVMNIMIEKRHERHHVADTGAIKIVIIIILMYFDTTRE